MKNDTTNEACKHTRSIKFGGRRRQCISCRMTWRIREKKRGPKALKRRTLNLQRTFIDQLTIAQQARRSSVSARGLAKRHAQSLVSLCEKPWPHAAPRGPLILVMDAMWFRKDDALNTVYLLGLRAVDGDEIHFLRPILRSGHESQKRWREAIGEIPTRTRKRIRAVVSDSFSGAGGITKEHGWVFQRCQAHLLLRLETMCGNNKRTVSFWEGRQELKRLAYALMNTRDEAKAARLADEFARLGNHRDCPTKLRMIVAETLRYLHEYRACYLHPELRLPATTNALENTNGRVRSLLNRSRGCRTPESLIRWITGFIYFHPIVKCRPKLPTKLKR
jgi:hypothetical protein